MVKVVSALQAVYYENYLYLSMYFLRMIAGAREEFREAIGMLELNREVIILQRAGASEKEVSKEEVEVGRGLG